MCVLRTPRDWGPATKLVGLASTLFAQGLVDPYVDDSGATSGSQRRNNTRSSSQRARASSFFGSDHLGREGLALRRLRMVVVDDDTWYPPRTVEALVRWSMRFPKAAVGQHGWVPSPDLVYAGKKKVRLGGHPRTRLHSAHNPLLFTAGFFK